MATGAIVILLIALGIVGLSFYLKNTGIFNQPASQPNSQSVTNLNESSSSESAQLKITKEITTSPVVQKALNEANQIKTASQSVQFSIKKIYQNNIVEAELGYIPGNKHSFWIYKKDGSWVKLYSGTQAPECQSLESLKIESGVKCLDSSRKTQCKTNRDCLYRTTR